MEKILDDIKLILQKRNFISMINDGINHYELSPGIPNIGNTCFHNSAMQILYLMREFVDYIITDEIRNQYLSNQKALAVIDLLRVMKKKASNTSNNVLIPSELTAVKSDICYYDPEYQPGGQGDVYEVLRKILFDFAESTSDPIDPRRNFIFKCKNYTCIQPGCDPADYKKWLAIPKIVPGYVPSFKGISGNPEKIEQLQTVIESMFSVQVTDKIIEKYECTDFNKYVIIHFNVGDETHRIDLPDQIKLEQKLYQLIGISYYIGSGSSGHYWTCIKYDSKWYEYNDAYRSGPMNQFDKSYLADGIGHGIPRVCLYKSIKTA